MRLRLRSFDKYVLISLSFACYLQACNLGTEVGNGNKASEPEPRPAEAKSPTEAQEEMSDTSGRNDDQIYAVWFPFLLAPCGSPLAGISDSQFLLDGVSVLQISPDSNALTYGVSHRGETYRFRSASDDINDIAIEVLDSPFTAFNYTCSDVQSALDETGQAIYSLEVSLNDSSAVVTWSSPGGGLKNNQISSIELIIREDSDDEGDSGTYLLERLE